VSSLIRATNLWGFDELVRIRGGDPRPLLARYHIPPEEQRDDRSFLIYRNVAALFDDTARILNYPEFGIKLAEYQGMDILGPVSVIARSSANVGNAIQSIARYLHLHCPALKITARTETAGVAQLHYTVDDESTGYRVQAYELAMSNAMQVLKLLCGETVTRSACTSCTSAPVTRRSIKPPSTAWSTSTSPGVAFACPCPRLRSPWPASTTRPGNWRTAIWNPSRRPMPPLSTKTSSA